MLIRRIFRRLLSAVLKSAQICFFLVFTIRILPGQNASFLKSDKAWALAHPFSVQRLKKIDKACDSIYKTVQHRAELDAYASGGKLDAFRHVFYFSAFAREIPVKKLRKLGMAHENQNYRQFLKGENDSTQRHDSLSMVMDLRNNELAFEQAERFRALPLTQLRDSVIALIVEGKAWILLRNRSGNFLNCDEKPISLNAYRHNWYLPKCLVPSNRIYKD